MDVVVNSKFKDSMYYQWAMWMMGNNKTQPKSGNYVAAGFLDVLSWCDFAWKSVEKDTILSGVERCYMGSDPGEEHEVEARPEPMQVEGAPKKKKKKIKVVKSKSPPEMARMELKERRSQLKLERERKRAARAANPKPAPNPKKVNRRKSPKKRVQRRKAIRQKRGRK